MFFSTVIVKIKRFYRHISGNIYTATFISEKSQYRLIILANQWISRDTKTKLQDPKML